MITMKPQDNATPEQRFQYAVHIVIEHEGGLSLDKRDPGGVTKWGISLRFLRTIGVDVHNDGRVYPSDVIALTEPRAIELYRKYFWDSNQYNQLKCIDIAAKVFDMAVNMGSFEANKLLQISINRLRTIPIKVDGMIGKNTLSAANDEDSIKLRQCLRDCSEHFYTELIANNPKLSCYKDGWLNRASW